MEILINIKDLNLLGTNAEKSQAVFEHINTIYTNTAQDKEAYLYEDMPEDIECVFGSDDPDTILRTARNWNKRLIDCYNLALSKIPVDLRPESLATRKYPASIYALKQAVLALDDSFDSYSDFAFLPDFYQDYFNAIIPDCDLKKIEEHPESYAIIYVWPK